MVCIQIKESEIIQNIVAPNVPDPWNKSFQLERRRIQAYMKQIMEILEVLERDEKVLETRKDRRKGS